MRVSQYFQLNRTQPTLDFVDIDIRNDLRVFVDPRALKLIPSSWGSECISLVQDYFRTVIRHIRENRDSEAQELLASLHEPNEVHLGLSVDYSQGRALGNGSAVNVWDSLRQSEAVRSGLLEDLEDTILMVEGVSSDIVSDMLINIIREPLINYTFSMAEQYGIPLTDGIASGPLWDPIHHCWYQEFVRLPMTSHGKLILVPKSIVRKRMLYNLQEYYNSYILSELQQQELAANTQLVQLLRNGNRRVTKKDLKEKYGQSKSLVIQETLKNPALLRQYREDKRNVYPPPIDHQSLAILEDTDPPDWDNLLTEAISLSPGRDQACTYEDRIEQLLTALFYPHLDHPQVQHQIHNGRKRIDITYTNLAVEGFFKWLGNNYPAMHVFVECKNYCTDISNPELDQISGRFSPSRGQFGLLVCRSFTDKNLFIQRCIDTAHDHRGFVMPFDDTDLQALIVIRKRRNEDAEFRFFKEKFDRLIM
ncbi:hypothetical protein [Chlorobium ferrooxidans]|uniref:Restriction endonuclease type IV Mrr domain-containing protein n=1 Tax=Chlorobium ferrooxidans DSM 13031 TaxID=377431 RepID=Q0YSV3_9CHLB|nr:hypothetical protein [Chlorobium ferrooxidans]EAT59514.1 conserved hypothetical protein [Chlorobium ferrooxidans DSM 13031]